MNVLPSDGSVHTVDSGVAINPLAPLLWQKVVASSTLELQKIFQAAAGDFVPSLVSWLLTYLNAAGPTGPDAPDTALQLHWTTIEAPADKED